MYRGTIAYDDDDRKIRSDAGTSKHRYDREFRNQYRRQWRKREHALAYQREYMREYMRAYRKRKA